MEQGRSKDLPSVEDLPGSADFSNREIWATIEVKEN
jgi:hypothetical protein